MDPSTMAVVAGTDENGTFLVLHFFDVVTVEQVLAASAQSVRSLSRDGPYQALLLFDESVDVSEIDAAAINAIRENRTRELHDHGLQRRGGAAVVDGSLHADIIMRLWNALSLGHPESEIPFEIFRDLESALAWLGIAREIAQPVIARTERTA